MVAVAERARESGTGRVYLRFTCPCGKRGKAPREYTGRRVRCRRCGVPVRVPGDRIAPARLGPERASPARDHRATVTWAPDEPAPRPSGSATQPTKVAPGRIAFGLVAIALGGLLGGWNEARSADRASDLLAASSRVVAASADAVDPALEGKLVHVAGPATTNRLLVDHEFGVRSNAIHLVREVETWQWKETKSTRRVKTPGGGETSETTHEYAPGWSAKRIDSSRFAERDGHENPRELPVEPRSWVADDVRLGARRLTSAQVEALGGLEAVAREELPVPRPGQHPIPGGYHLGSNPRALAIGDARVTFRVVRPGEVSLIAEQAGQTFRPMRMESGAELSLLVAGRVPAEAMIADARSGNAIMTWILRAVGLALLACGARSIVRCRRPATGP